MPARHTKEELVELLSAYRRHERAPDNHDGVRELLRDLHDAWLPTYRASLDHFAPSSEDTASWREFDVYYGRLAKAAEPFLAELGRRLNAARTEPDAADRVDHQVIDDLQRHLHARFELALAWVVEADANVYCVQTGIDKANTRREDYLAYLDSTFRDSESYHRFYLKFPVLGRWLACVTALLADYGQELIRHLSTDSGEVGEAFFGREITRIRSVRPGAGDYHAGGRSVVKVDVELADGGRESLFYKPRSLSCESAMQDLLGRLNSAGVVGFRPRPILAKAGYGYEAVIPAGRNHVHAPEEVQRIYQELGGYLAIFYVLGGGDLHFENILVADGHAFACDGETILSVRPLGRAPDTGTVLDSVYRTGLLEWPRAAPAPGDSTAQMKISGYAGGEQYEMPVTVPRINEHRLSFDASVVHQAGVLVKPKASNRVFLNGELVQPQDYTSSIMDGFNRVYEWFQGEQDDAIKYLHGIFTGSSVRFINWATQIYAQLLLHAQHPKCLMDPLEVDLLANTIRTFPRNWDKDGVLAAREVLSLWRLDVPIFSSDAHGKHLLYDHTEILPCALEISPLDHAADRIKRLSIENRDQQSRYIAASLSAEEISSASFRSTSVDYAVKIGSRLCRMLREPSAPAPWTSYQTNGQEIQQADIESDLFLGSAGIALFLAYLNDIAPRTEFREAAERALAHALSGADTERVGAFAGFGGFLYLLTHLHHLWHDDTLLEQAIRLSAELPRRIDQDRHFDVLHGVAGLIPVLIGLASVTDDRILEHAHQCAEHLLSHAEPFGDTLSWPSLTPDDVEANLTGFSHGAGGIGWALIALGTHTDRADYIAAGRRAFAYESLHFDDVQLDWYDLRKNTRGITHNGRHFSNAWCNGAAGIGMSRITSWAALGKTDETILRESYQALAATIHNFPRLKNHTLCHGTSGNAELLLRLALLRDEPAFQLEANVQVQALWRNLDEAENGISSHSAHFFPGLMLGISGFGMHCLRLAYPDRVPSVLLLDPPQTAPAITERQ